MAEIAELDAPMTDREAAVYLRLKGEKSYLTVQKWARRGLIKGGKAGDQWRFRKRDLDDYMFQQR